MLRHILGIGLALALFAASGLGADEKGKGGAQSWSGTLADAACKAQNPAQPCEVSASTTSFGIVTGTGMFSKFDDQGNSQAASQLRGKTGSVKVKVTGKLAGDTIQVSEVQIDSQ